jgi:DNA-binding GntR family transcriptional regulator
MRTVFVPVDIGDNLRGLDLEHFSILNHLNQNPETRVAKMEVRVQAATVMDLEAELMEVEENSTILVRSVVFWDLGGRPVMAGRVIYLSQYVNLKMEITAESVSNGCNIKEIPAIDYWG